MTSAGNDRRHFLARRARSGGCGGAGPARDGKSSATSPAAARSVLPSASAVFFVGCTKGLPSHLWASSREVLPTPDRADPCSRRRRPPSPTSTTPRRVLSAPIAMPRSIDGTGAFEPWRHRVLAESAPRVRAPGLGVLRPKNLEHPLPDLGTVARIAVGIRDLRCGLEEVGTRPGGVRCGRAVGASPA